MTNKYCFKLSDFPENTKCIVFENTSISEAGYNSDDPSTCKAILYVIAFQSIPDAEAYVIKQMSSRFGTKTERDFKVFSVDLATIVKEVKISFKK